jgi:hypothetical protein
MFGLQMLDVAIGIIFIYLLMSLVCSAISEIIETVLKCRARCLERSLRELFNDAQGTGPTKQLYKHPLIYGLFRGEYDPTKIKKNGYYQIRSTLPSYIPARDFALALMDIVSPATNATKSGADCDTAMANTTNMAETSKPKSLNPLQIAIRAFQNPQIKKALTPLVDAAGDDISKVRENIEAWYNSTMERVTGWYKKHTQLILLIVAFVVTIAVNVDTLTITKYLSLSDAAHNAVVAGAQEFVKQSASSQETAAQSALPAEKLEERLSAVQKLSLPIGWSDAELRRATSKLSGCRDAISPHSVGWLVTAVTFLWYISSPHLIGWTITAIALSMGASFWFDFLKKLIAIRSSIKPEEKTSEEESTQKEQK